MTWCSCAGAETINNQSILPQHRGLHVDICMPWNNLQWNVPPYKHLQKEKSLSIKELYSFEQSTNHFQDSGSRTCLTSCSSTLYRLWSCWKFLIFIQTYFSSIKNSVFFQCACIIYKAVWNEYTATGDEQGL